MKVSEEPPPAVLAATVEDPPASWSVRYCLKVGGLLAVGFGSDERFILVESSSGRGLFDRVTGQRVARDYDETGGWSDGRRCQGIGALEGEWVAMAGLFGGELPQSSEDGWSVHCYEPPGSDSYLVVVPPGNSIDDHKAAIRRLRPPVTESACLRILAKRQPSGFGDQQ